MINRETKYNRLMKKIKAISVVTDRDNANVGSNFSAKLLRIASEASKQSVLDELPKVYADAHTDGDFHIHDLDSYNLTINCLNIHLKEALKDGFNTGYGHLSEPARITTAATNACIILQSSQNDCFGGQGFINYDNDMVDYALKSYNEIVESVKGILSKVGVDFNINDNINDIIKSKFDKELHQAAQIVICNLNSMHSRAGSQIPFSSINLGIPKQPSLERQELAYMICKTFLEEYEKGINGAQPIFPNIIFRVKDGVNLNEDDEYYELFEIACRVACKRMNPTFMNLDSPANKKLYDKGIIAGTMGCRTYIGPDVNGDDSPVKRGNIAPVTINLPRLAILASKHNTEQSIKEDAFIRMFADMIDLGKDQLLHRYDTLKKLKGSDIPFIWSQGLIAGSEDIGENDSIEPILKHGTWALL